MRRFIFGPIYSPFSAAGIATGASLISRGLWGTALAVLVIVAIIQAVCERAAVSR